MNEISDAFIICKQKDDGTPLKRLEIPKKFRDDHPKEHKYLCTELESSTCIYCHYGVNADYCKYDGEFIG